MDSGAGDSNSIEKSVHNSGNHCPSSVPQKSKRNFVSKATNFLSTRKSGKQITKKKDRALAKKIIQDSNVTSQGFNKYERLNIDIPSNIVLTNDNNIPCNPATQYEGDHNSPTYGISSGSYFDDAPTSVNCISHLRENNKGSADDSFSSLEFNQMPTESYNKPPSRQGGKLGNIESNEDAWPPTENSSTTESTQSDDSFNHTNTFKNVDLEEMGLSNSAPPTENTFARKSSLPSCELDNSVGQDKRKKQLCASLHTHTLLKPATSDCPPVLGTSINVLEDSVNKKHNSVLKSGDTKLTDFYSNVSTGLQILNAVELADIKKVLPKTSGLENLDGEIAVSNQSDISKEELNNENFDITKAQLYAWKLRSLPKDQLIEVEKKISAILDNSLISAATGLSKSQAISMWNANPLPSISKENLSTEPDNFETKALSFINILKKLPKEKFDEVDKNISHILWKAQIALGEKSQDITKMRRKPLPFSWGTSASQNEELSSSGQGNDVSNCELSPERKRIHPSLAEMQYSKERVASNQENNECTDDDASEEEISNEHEPPKKTVTTSTPVIKWPSERISKLPKCKTAFPKPSTSYKYVLKFVLAFVVLLCAMAAAFFGVTHWPKTFEGFSKTNLSPQPVANIMKYLKDEFSEQPPMTFNVISAALRRVTIPYPKEPAIILLLAEQGAEEVALQFAHKIADSVSANNMVVVPGYAYDTKDHDEAKKEIDDLLMEKLSVDQLMAVLVERLDKIPPDVASIFHTYCDHENASFKRVVYLMTIASTKTQLKSLSNKEWDVIADEHLNEVWIKGGNDQISSLLSRLTVSVAAIVSSG